MLPFPVFGVDIREQKVCALGDQDLQSVSAKQLFAEGLEAQRATSELGKNAVEFAQVSPKLLKSRAKAMPHL